MASQEDVPDAEVLDKCLFLHDEHRQTDFLPVSIEKISECLLPRQGDRGPEAHSFAPDRAVGLRLARDRLVLSREGAGVAGSVVLVLAKVLLGRDNVTGLPCIALAPAKVAMGAWLILVHGDDALALRVMQLMSERGAVRSDFFSLYKLEEKPLGKGSMAMVFRVLREEEGAEGDCTELVAKVTRDSMKGWSSRQGGLPEDMQQEVSMLTQLSHPNVVRFHGAFSAEDKAEPGARRAIVLLEYCSGGVLGAAARTGLFSEARAREIMSGLFSALAHVHSCVVVHRDVKPDNVLISSDGRPVLADFGIACCATDEVQMARRCGSPGYVAPEVISAKAYSYKVDCFGAGALLYYILSGEAPFEAETMMDVLEKTRLHEVDLQARRCFRQVSPPCRDFLQVLLRKKPTQRPSAELAQSHHWIVQDPSMRRSGNDSSAWKSLMQMDFSSTVRGETGMGSGESKTPNSVSFSMRIKDFVAGRRKPPRRASGTADALQAPAASFQARVRTFASFLRAGRKSGAKSDGAKGGSEGEEGGERKAAKSDSLNSLTSGTLSTATGATWATKAFSRQTSPESQASSSGVSSTGRSFSRQVSPEEAAPLGHRHFLDV